MVEGDYVFRLTVVDDENDTDFDEMTITVLPEPDTGGFALRINTGGSTTTYQGNEFIADTYFNTGNTLNRPQTGLSEPYKTMRYSRSQTMSYDIPVQDGEYQVKLHFAELWFGATGGGSGGVGSRVFDVNIEGQLVEDNLDVFAEAGADSPLVKTHTVTVTGGVLDIDFSSLAAVGGTRHPIINAIEVLGGSTGSGSQIAGGKNGNFVNEGNQEMVLLDSRTQILGSLVPNPASEYTTIEISAGLDDVLDIYLFDISGKLVRTIFIRRTK